MLLQQSLHGKEPSLEERDRSSIRVGEGNKDGQSTKRRDNEFVPKKAAGFNIGMGQHHGDSGVEFIPHQSSRSNEGLSDMGR